MSQFFLKLNIAWFLGAVIGTLIISGTLYFEFLPRYIFLIFAFISVICIVIFYKICPKKKIGNDISSLNENIPDSHKSDLRILKDPVVIMVSLVLFLFLGSTIGLSTWLTTYFFGLGISVAYGSAILSLYWLFSFIGLIITTKIVVKYKEIDILFYSFLGGIIFLAIFSFIPFIYIKIAALALTAFCFAPILPLTTGIAVKRNLKNSGTIFGFTIAFAFAGTIVFQPLYGYITEYFGEKYIAYISLIGVLIGFIFAVILFKINKKEQIGNIISKLKN